MLPLFKLAYLFVIWAVVCAATEAVAAETLLVAGTGGTNERVFKEKLIPAFEAETGGKVAYLAGTSIDILAKLQAQKGRQEISVAMMGDGPMHQAVDQGLCTSLDKAVISESIYPSARVYGDMAVGIGFVAAGLAFNRMTFAKNGWAPPTSWRDLADVKYRQRIVVPPITNGYGLVALVMLARLNGGGEANIDPGFEVLTSQVAPNVLSWEPSSAKLAQLLQTGEAALAVWGNGRALAVADQGSPVEFVFPKEGAVIILSSACVVNGAPRSALAKKFVRHVLSKEAQATLAISQGLGPVNSATKLPQDAIDRVVYGPEKINALIPLDHRKINLQRAAWTNRWNRTVER